MQFSNAIRIAAWLRSSYESYLLHLADNGDPVAYEGERSGDWDAQDALRVSRIAKDCPRYHAMKVKNLIERQPLGLLKAAQFEDAVRAAQVVYESIAWACLSNPYFELKTEVRTLPGEHHSGLVGTIDAVLKFNRNRLDADPIYLPIEVKRTDADSWWGKPSGISLDQFLQVVGEMVLIGKADWGDCPYGFLFNRYDWKGKDEDELERRPLCKVWTVYYHPEYNGWVLYDGPDAVFTEENSDWPTLPNGQVFLSVQEYLDLVNLHKKYLGQDDPMNGEAPYEFLTNWRCASKKASIYYAESGKRKGEIKDGTGIVKPRCEFFHICYSARLESAGFTLPLDVYPYDALVKNG